MIQLIKKEDSPVANAYQTLKTFQGRKLSKMYHQAFPKAHFDKPPTGHEKDKGMWKHPSGINLIVCSDGSFQLF